MISFTDLFGAQRAKLVPAEAIKEMQSEGAGFAGGIVSAALDGMRCAQAVTLHVGLPIQNRDAET